MSRATPRRGSSRSLQQSNSLYAISMTLPVVERRCAVSKACSRARSQTFARHLPIKGAATIDPNATPKATCIVSSPQFPRLATTMDRPLVSPIARLYAAVLRLLCLLSLEGIRLDIPPAPAHLHLPWDTAPAGIPSWQWRNSRQSSSHPGRLTAGLERAPTRPACRVVESLWGADREAHTSLSAALHRVAGTGSAPASVWFVCGLA